MVQPPAAPPTTDAPGLRSCFRRPSGVELHRDEDVEHLSRFGKGERATDNVLVVERRLLDTHTTWPAMPCTLRGPNAGLGRVFRVEGPRDLVARVDYLTRVVQDGLGSCDRQGEILVHGRAHAVVNGAYGVGPHDAGELEVELVDGAFAGAADDDRRRRLGRDVRAESGSLLALDRDHSDISGGPLVEVRLVLDGRRGKSISTVADGGVISGLNKVTVLLVRLASQLHVRKRVRHNAKLVRIHCEREHRGIRMVR